MYFYKKGNFSLAFYKYKPVKIEHRLSFDVSNAFITFTYLHFLSIDKME